jgi:hypothetical protein
MQRARGEMFFEKIKTNVCRKTCGTRHVSASYCKAGSYADFAVPWWYKNRGSPALTPPDVQLENRNLGLDVVDTSSHFEIDICHPAAVMGCE